MMRAQPSLPAKIWPSTRPKKCLVRRDAAPRPGCGRLSSLRFIFAREFVTINLCGGRATECNRPPHDQHPPVICERVRKEKSEAFGREETRKQLTDSVRRQTPIEDDRGEVLPPFVAVGTSSNIPRRSLVVSSGRSYRPVGAKCSAGSPLVSGLPFESGVVAVEGALHVDQSEHFNIRTVEQ
ncbi:hypothetical protein EVAR_28954_1 [Eumeta japonica]|uniref:Uncharacterized protein n=1 Tax=Eumeta variegata TaxID=151549 RepID=A0A4C1VXN1_EUMVA|nr:hypothetical protein EVAR_28954_1 [Eumeta japonica]